ncbi:peptidoglycan-binding protein [Streptomyces sp. NPDC006692]|uniref:peptidoglycan-binding domain-containing protein n=1 Tax=Streptomyces sp. NPDC006692 TaxID=3364758 RepID=UPI0036924371
MFAKAGLVVAAGALLTGTTVGTAQANTNAGYIGYGYSNNTHAVWCVQQLTNSYAKWGGGRALIPEDGVWGPQTYDQLRWFQSHWPQLLDADGVVGPKTGNVLLYASGDTVYGGSGGYCNAYIPTTF